MSNTIQQLYQGEERVVQLTLYNRDNTSFAPSGAYFQVVDSDGDVIVTETDATISENIISCVIDTTTTATVGTYFIIWRIMQTGSTFYHKTRLQIVTLLPDI